MENLPTKTENNTDMQSVAMLGTAAIIGAVVIYAIKKNFSSISLKSGDKELKFQKTNN